MRSHHGCTTCRQRKLKCDEVKPHCGQCARSGRICVFSDDSKFRHFDAHALNDRNAGSGSGDKASPHSHEAAGSLFGTDQVWLNIPADLTFVNIVNPFDTDDATFSEDEMSPMRRGRGRHGWDMLPTPHESDSEPVLLEMMNAATEAPSPPSSPIEPQNNAASSFTTSPVVGDAEHSAAAFTTSTPPIHVRTDDEPGLDDDADDAQANILALQLIRHFREGPGQWMDLFDTSAYFSRKIPIRATTRPLLKSAICALAAKHLSRTQHHTHHTHHDPDPKAPDWQYHAVRFYHQAIRRLKTAIAHDSSSGGSSGEAGEGHPDTFAAVAMLCIYELINAPGHAWKAHLTALPLYSSSSSSSGVEVADAMSPVPIPRSPIRGPIFWALARQDFLCAFVSETQTRLNLGHVRMWQNFGLATMGDEEGLLLLPFSPFCTAEARVLPAAGEEGEGGAEEDARSNELLWLLGKIVNYITSGDGICSEDYARPAGWRMAVGLCQEVILERWQLLDDELRRWVEGLPATFEPSARSEGPGMERVWYAVPQCAATMQSYHMAAILLLVNRPHESTAIRSTVSARLRSYRHVQDEVRRHAREICGISLADPTAAVRVHSVQPLFVAGQSFHEEADQELVVGLLEGIERDLGWATEYQISKLREEWAAR
ncbi:Transcription activator AMTR1 [Colletotrichum spinosum]|uniref:Transcription activator AMTR1 n=1 Tax=Colletotrichum spinosum TaxID=1347390 RepID=A0A4R8Q1A3_9PEZI|nr:Transcription activator AMTR1 [Colletotrichum spinosum]